MQNECKRNPGLSLFLPKGTPASNKSALTGLCGFFVYPFHPQYMLKQVVLSAVFILITESLPGLIVNVSRVLHLSYALPFYYSAIRNYY